ncbi:uncharacterized protein LOC135850085 isoform X6 [Planococcus citri]|uniref:uncharacterized protein LOC135850085 isoform X6 n=1 Tax=Planococcus citri TaxID=170843 RepID=UPI0031F817B1
MNRNHVFSEKEAQWLFGENVRSLQELASVQYVWKLWSNIMLSGKYHDIKSELKVALDETYPIVYKFIKRLKLDPSVVCILKKAVALVKSELELWMIYNHEEMLSGRKMTFYTCQLKYFKFKPNMRLDYEGSARNLITYKQVDDRTAFEIMCLFCMEDELYRLPKAKVNGFLKKITFEKHPLAWYWICYLTNKEALKNVGELICMNQGECCLENIILSELNIANWPTVKWFWQHLCCETERMNSAVVLPAVLALQADIYRTWFLHDFYYVLNEDQWQYVFNTAAIDILFAFFRHHQKFDQGCFLWERLRDSMTIEQFVDLMEGLMEPKETNALKYCFPATTMLWNTAPDRFKNHILNEQNSFVIDNFFESSFIRQFDKNLQFLFELLDFASIEYREEMILTHGDVLFQVDDFSKIDRIVELCLPDASQRDRFKLFLAKSEMIEGRCQELFVKGDFIQLNKFFESFCPNEFVVNDYRKRLLSSEKPFEAFIFEPNKWRDFEKFVGSVDSNSPLYTIARDRVLGSCKLTHFNNWSNVEQLGLLEKAFVQFFTQEELAELKTKFLDELRDMLNGFFTTFACNEQEFFTAEFLEKFVSWSNSSDEGFKSELPVDSIFVSTITSFLYVLRVLRYERLDATILVALDEFFKWYFVGAEQAKKYKMTKIFAFDDAKFYQEFNETAKVNDQDVDVLLAWMFENDEERIRKFKAKCGFENVLKMSSMLSL